MGQGTESCGGYNYEYDAAYEGLNNEPPMWNDRIPINEMSCTHIRNAIRVAKIAAKCAPSSFDEGTWNEWVEVLQMEQEARRSNGVKIKADNDCLSGGRKGNGRKGRSTTKKRIEKYKSMEFTGSAVQMKCHCGNIYTAKVADLKRGWATSCSKRCAAIRREYGRPCAELINKVDG